MSSPRSQHHHHYRRSRSRSRSQGGSIQDTNEGWEEVSYQRTTSHKRSEAAKTEEIYSQFMIILVGLPGSGKSHFAESLQSSKPNKFVRINQDQLKSRQKCEQRCRQAIHQGKIPIIDRCNFDIDQRRYFLQIAHESNIPVDCIHFDYASKTCLNRCLNRGEHETITRKNAKMVVSRMNSQLNPPNCEDEQSDFQLYQNVNIITSFREANQAIYDYLT